MSEKITVIGAGLMGHGIAQIFAVCGHEVALTDTNAALLAAAKDRVRANLEMMSAFGIDIGGPIDQIVAHIRIAPDLETACAGCDVVIEAVFEDVALKQRIFADLDRLCPPRVILCSNTSVISIAHIAQNCQHRERVLGTHFWNPPHLVPLVEVIRTAETADAHFKAIYELLKRVGKHPVYVHKDVPGFVGNRLQQALWREAFSIIDTGICDAATIDEVITNGFGLRLPVLGSVANADLIGLDLTLNMHNYLLPHIDASPIPSPGLQAKVQAGDLGMKTGSGYFNWTEAESAAVRDKLTRQLMQIMVARQKSQDAEQS